MFKNLSFGDSLMKDSGILQPEETSSYALNTVLGLARRNLDTFYSPVSVTQLISMHVNLALIRRSLVLEPLVEGWPT